MYEDIFYKQVPGGQQVVVEAELILLVVVQQDHRPCVILFL